MPDTILTAMQGLDTSIGIVSLPGVSRIDIFSPFPFHIVNLFAR